METIFEIRVAHDGSRVVAWDPNAQTEVAEAKIRTGQAGMTEQLALAYALKVLTERVTRNTEWMGY